MLTIRLSIGHDYIDVAGDLALPDVIPVIHSWLAALPLGRDQALAHVERRLNTLVTLSRAIQAQGSAIMATVNELSSELTAIKTAVDEVKRIDLEQIAEIQALKDQIAAGTPVTQEQLDSLDAQADSILAALGVPPAPEG